MSLCFPAGGGASFLENLPEGAGAGRARSAGLYCLPRTRKDKSHLCASPADGGASFFENLPEGVALGEAAGGISRATTLSPRSPRPGGPDDAAVAGAAEADIQRALLVGNYAAALDVCLAVRHYAPST